MEMMRYHVLIVATVGSNMVTFIVNYDTSQCMEVEPTPITLKPNEVSKEDAIQLLQALDEYDRQYE